MAASDKLSEAYISAAQRDDPPCSQPQRSEQQEWTVQTEAGDNNVGIYPRYGKRIAFIHPRIEAERIVAAHNAALAAAYEKGCPNASKHRNTKGESPIAIRNKAISDAHNAALAAYEKEYAKAYDELKDQIDGG
jgi:hypothetical protein